MDLADAAQNFTRASRHCDNLIEIHQKHGGPKQGKRDKETTLNRAVVILTVAAWQAVVQDLTYACVDLSTPGPTSPNLAMFNVLAGRVRKEVHEFATPNAENTRKLLTTAGFDPRPHWTWTQPGRNGSQKAHQVEEKINGWLKIRHAIAHGHATLPSATVLQVVRKKPNNPPSDPALRLTDAKQCLSFFRLLARTTGRALAKHLQLHPPADWA